MLLTYILVFLTVAIIAGFIIPQILLIAFRKNLFDEIDPRKIHKGTVPRLGGIAFFPSILFSILFITGLMPMIPMVTHLTTTATLTTINFITCSVIILYLVGMADDLIGVKYRAKFVAQIFSAALIVAGGIYINDLHGFLGISELTEDPTHLTFDFGSISAALLTILLTVFITNAINLIDGIDGLASGLSAIACAFFGFIFYQADMHLYGMISFATLGALLPFFYYNVFGDAKKHSKIFMGDTGALTIGLVLSILSIRTCQIDDTTCSPNMAVVAFAPLLIPCFDVVRVYLHRIRMKRNPFLPDKTHIHHKLLALGIHQRLAMPAIVVSSLLLTLLNYWLSFHLNITLLFALDLAIWILVNTLLSHAIHRRELRTNQKLYD